MPILMVKVKQYRYDESAAEPAKQLPTCKHLRIIDIAVHRRLPTKPKTVLARQKYDLATKYKGKQNTRII